MRLKQTANKKSGTESNGKCDGLGRFCTTKPDKKKRGYDTLLFIPIRTSDFWVETELGLNVLFFWRFELPKNVH